MKCDKVNISTTKHENLQDEPQSSIIPVPLFLARAALHTEVVPSLKAQNIINEGM